MQDFSNDIIMQAAQGDIDAFERLYRATSGFAYNVALRITGNKQDAEEVIQDVFLKIHKNLKSFEFRSSFKTWVYRITVNAAINASKRSRRETDRHIEYDDTVDQKVSLEVKEKNIDELDKQEVIKSLLGTLNPDQRACIVLRSIQGLSYKEISDALNININTVRTRLKRAREILLNRFEKRGDKKWIAIECEN